MLPVNGVLPFAISCHCEPVTDVTGVAIRSPSQRLKSESAAGGCGLPHQRARWFAMTYFWCGASFCAFPQFLFIAKAILNSRHSREFSVTNKNVRRFRLTFYVFRRAAACGPPYFRCRVTAGHRSPPYGPVSVRCGSAGASDPPYGPVSVRCKSKPLPCGSVSVS